MASFATSYELADRLQTDFDALQRSQADELLTSTTAMIKREARQTIELVTNDAVTLDASSTRVLLLPELPVVSVASVTVDGVVLTESVDYLVSANGVLASTNRLRTWRSPAAVVYTHGYATVPGDLKAICIEAAARAWVNPRGVLSEQIGTYSARFVNNKPGLVLLDHEMAIVHSYRPPM